MGESVLLLSLCCFSDLAGRRQDGLAGDGDFCITVLVAMEV